MNTQQLETLKKAGLAVASAFGLTLPAVAGMSLLELFQRAAGNEKLPQDLSVEEYLQDLLQNRLPAAQARAHAASEATENLLGGEQEE